MRVLLAAPSRDLLSCYKKLLDAEMGETLTAFDATQIPVLLAGFEFDLAIVDRTLPRLGQKQVLDLIKGKGIPVILLVNTAITPDLLIKEPLANAILAYPFAPSELIGTIKSLLQKLASDESYSLLGKSARVSDFRLPSGKPITDAETDVLLSLLKGEAIKSEDGGVYAASLNRKFAIGEIEAKIEYIAGEGFKLVT